MTYVTPHMRETIETLQLSRTGESSFLMRRPNRSDYLTNIIFAAGRIIIVGDLTIDGNGAVSVCGYGLEWFAGHKSESYLCEKFLHRKWVPEKAQATLLEWAKDDRKNRKAYMEIIREFEYGEMHEHRLYEALVDARLDNGDGVPGYDYDPADAGWLCALQQGFREKYAALVESEQAACA